MPASGKPVRLELLRSREWRAALRSAPWPDQGALRVLNETYSVLYFDHPGRARAADVDLHRRRRQANAARSLDAASQL